jgi:type VI secretion system protein ImpF
MANVEVKLGLLPSLVDRLIDPESAGNAIMIGYDTRKMAEAVRRDLEDLLNTRSCELPGGDRLPEVSTSIVQFGLPDLVSAEAMTDDQRRAIGRTIEVVIERYETRLKDVRVQLLDPTEDVGRAVIRFKIDAELNVSPAEPVAFDTVLEVGSGHLVVRAAANE